MTLRSSLWVVAPCFLLAACDSGGSDDAGCQHETDQAFCTRLGKNCDLLSAFDNCGQSRSVNCGTCGGACQDNVCAGGGTTGGTGGGTTGGTSGGTSGGTTGGGDAGPVDAGPPDAGCPTAGCPTTGTWLEGDFVLDTFAVHDSTTFDPLVGEHLSWVASFTPGSPGCGQEGPNQIACIVPTGEVHLGFAGDTAGVIAPTMLANGLQDQTGYFTASFMSANPDAVSDGGNLDFEALGATVSQVSYTIELSCSAPGIVVSSTGATLATSPCTGATIIFRRFSSGTMSDFLSNTTLTTMTLHVTDGG